MKQVKKQQGYALLVVLLMVVLFMGVAATFMAGSLSNAKQEQTVDASNQSVASAEMGVRYYSADFQREIGIIKTEIIEITQNRIKNIVDCFNSGNSSCDEQTELTALESAIDADMKAEYISRVFGKVAELNTLKDVQITPFPGEDAQYAVAGTSIKKFNEAEKNVDLASTTDKTIKWLKVQLDLSGQSRGTTKYLKGIFTVEVPNTFLSTSDSLTLETQTIANNDLTYDDIFFESWSQKNCTALMAEITAGNLTSEKECLLVPGQSAADFVNFLKGKNLDPKDFKVFTNNFADNICSNSCNNLKLGGITIVAKPGDAGLFGNGGKNLNSISTINLLIDGHFDPKNMNSLGEDGYKQTIILRELTVQSNLAGSGLLNTNLLILGKKYTTGPILADSRMEFQSKLKISDNGRVCFDLDRIIPDHVDLLSETATFTQNNTTGQIIYYTSDPAKKFYLSEKKGTIDVERTKLYVQGYNKYTDFLSSCGINVSETTSEITDVPYPYILDPGFSLDVEY